VKVLSPELAAGVSVERFRREIMLAAKLQHPHIVPVLSSGDADGLPWFTMPYVEGESLRHRLSRGRSGSARPRGSCAMWRAHSSSRTATALSIATSNLTTCCSRGAARR
jgi:serine/threonine protein kinase